MRSSDYVLVGSKWLLAFPRVPIIPDVPLTQTIFLPAAPCTTADREHTASLKSVALFLSCLPFHSFPFPDERQLHPNPGPICPCSVCAGNVTWRGKSVQCWTYSKWIHLRCSQLSFSRFHTLGCSHSWSCPPCCFPASPRDSTSTNIVTSSSDSSSLYTSTVLLDPFGSPSANAAFPHRYRLQTSYPPSAHFVSSFSAPCPPPHVPCYFLYLLFPLATPTPSRFFNRLLEVTEPAALNYYTLSRFIMLTLYVFRNLTLIHLPLSGSLGSPLCDLIVATAALAFFLPVTRILPPCFAR